MHGTECHIGELLTLHLDCNEGKGVVKEFMGEPTEGRGLEGRSQRGDVSRGDWRERNGPGGWGRNGR